MFLFADWVVCNGIEFISAAVSRPLSIIDKGVIIDTGSTDGTLEFAQAMAAKYPEKLSVVDFGSLAPKYEISNARNMAWNIAPTNTTWHWNISDDEIYNWQDLPELRRFLEKHEDNPARFVNMHFHEYGLNKAGKIDSAHEYQRVMIHRWTKSAKWSGVWGREAVFYPDGCHTNSKKSPEDLLDPNIYYHHFNWLREKQEQVVRWNDKLREEGR